MVPDKIDVSVLGVMERGACQLLQRQWYPVTGAAGGGRQGENAIL